MANDDKKYYFDESGQARVKPRCTMIVNGQILGAGTKLKIEKPTKKEVEDGNK